MHKIFKNTKKIHFIGIGGIGMSGMAELLHENGFKQAVQISRSQKEPFI